jgi:hypothetical protein
MPPVVSVKKLLLTQRIVIGRKIALPGRFLFPETTGGIPHRHIALQLARRLIRLERSRLARPGIFRWVS